jgi:hypothetical protein
VAIQAVWAQRGMTVVGAEDDRPKCSGVAFTFMDSWAWKFVMYLSTLEIHMNDAETHSLIATGIWRKLSASRLPRSTRKHNTSAADPSAMIPALSSG